MGGNKQRGQLGERLAEEFLRNKGLEIVSRNYRFEQAEVDLVCRDGRELVFVEVKTRTSSLFGDPEEAVTEAKQDRLRKAAEGFCLEFSLENTLYRFDIVTVLMEGKLTMVRHLMDAF